MTSQLVSRDLRQISVQELWAWEVKDRHREVSRWLFCVRGWLAITSRNTMRGKLMQLQHDMQPGEGQMCKVPHRSSTKPFVRKHWDVQSCAVLRRVLQIHSCKKVVVIGVFPGVKNQFYLLMVEYLSISYTLFQEDWFREGPLRCQFGKVWKSGEPFSQP